MLKIINSGIQTLIGDYKGRTGYMDLGIAHSGSMDHYASRVANLVVKNKLDEATIEIPVGGFMAEFTEETVICITGADFGCKINNKPAPTWQAIKINPGDVISSGQFNPSVMGFRQYIAITGGIDVPVFLGSKSTAMYGAFGGYEGRPFKKGDEVKLVGCKNADELVGRKFKDSLIPQYKTHWELRAIPGPNGAPDYFTEEGMEIIFSSEYKTQIFADRSGIRLEGPAPIFSPNRIGDTGHPSNIVDHGYPGPGCVNISGETLILFPRECPTSGGFVVALSIIYADQWIMGQLVPGRDSIKFVYTTPEEALKTRKEQDATIVESSIIK